jgi:hypothetical protein
MTVDKILGFVVVAIVIALGIPIAIEALVGVDTTTWPAALVSVWEFLPIGIGIGVLIGVFAYFKTRPGQG